MSYQTPLTPGDDPRGESRSPDAIGHASATDVTAHLLAGPLSMGAVGWVADYFLHTAFLLPLGALAGVALGLYVVWFRYGREG